MKQIKDLVASAFLLALLSSTPVVAGPVWVTEEVFFDSFVFTLDVDLAVVSWFVNSGPDLAPAIKAWSWHTAYASSFPSYVSGFPWRVKMAGAIGRESPAFFGFLTQFSAVGTCEKDSDVSRPPMSCNIQTGVMECPSAAGEYYARTGGSFNIALFSHVIWTNPVEADCCV